MGGLDREGGSGRGEGGSGGGGRGGEGGSPAGPPRKLPFWPVLGGVWRARKNEKKGCFFEFFGALFRRFVGTPVRGVG